MRLALALAFALTASPHPRAPERVGAIVKRAVETYGGAAALQRARAVSERGKVISTARGGMEGTILRIYERPRRLRVEVRFPAEEPEIRVLDGARGFRRGEEVTGMPLAAMVLQAARTDLPWILAQPGAHPRDAGPVSRDGRTLRAIRLDLGQGLSVTAEIDPGSGRILRSTGTLQGPQGAVEFVTEYSDFRKVKGVLFAWREANFASGQQTAVTALDAIDTSAAAPEGSFRP